MLINQAFCSFLFFPFYLGGGYIKCFLFQNFTFADLQNFIYIHTRTHSFLLCVKFLKSRVLQMCLKCRRLSYKTVSCHNVDKKIVAISPVFLGTRQHIINHHCSG